MDLISFYELDSANKEFVDTLSQHLSKFVKRHADRLINHDSKPYGKSDRLSNAESALVKNDDNNFHIRMDVSCFKPEEISIKVDSESLYVSGKHEEQKDHLGYIKREFTRRYPLPKDVQVRKIKSSLNEDTGILTLCAPKKQASLTKAKERVIPIQFDNAGSSSCGHEERSEVENKMEQVD